MCIVVSRKNILITLQLSISATAGDAKYLCETAETAKHFMLTYIDELP
jgi:hypothetical protein